MFKTYPYRVGILFDGPYDPTMYSGKIEATSYMNAVQKVAATLPQEPAAPEKTIRSVSISIGLPGTKIEL